MGFRSSIKTKVNGIEVELFPIGKLAYELGRNVQSVRKWEIAGILPNSCFKDNLGRRFYTQEQIDAIVSIAEKCKIMQGSSAAKTSFSAKVHEALHEINKKYLNKKEE